MSKEHANHNEEACDYLLNNGTFNDWVITTAFYSALHHVQVELFPLNKDERIFESFNDYFIYKKSKLKKNLDKHTETLELVREEMRGSFPPYKWLLDRCMTARYHNYIVDEGTAKSAKKNLEILKGYLRKK